MKKNVILISTIFLTIALIIGYRIYYKKVAIEQAVKENKSYESFYNKEILGTDVISIINKAIDSNEKNQVEKDEKGNYIDNFENSIEIKLKFKELDQIITMERINEVGMQQFWLNYGALSFKCTNIEYHTKTNNVKSMYFEQI